MDAPRCRVPAGSALQAGDGPHPQRRCRVADDGPCNPLDGGGVGLQAIPDAPDWFRLTHTACHLPSPSPRLKGVPESRFEPVPYVRIKHPEWSQNATIYQINTRQFTPEGTFRAAEAHLPRLKELGVDILWLMPIHPIGEKNRKGTLGSPYSVQDYYGVNPEFGTLEDFKHFVDSRARPGPARHPRLGGQPHRLGQPPGRASTRSGTRATGRATSAPRPGGTGPTSSTSTTIARALRQYMTEAMKYWVREADIDGYRCDVAGFVPTDFWENGARGAGRHQAGLHAGRVGIARPARRGLRHDLRLELVRRHAPDLPRARPT